MKDPMNGMPWCRSKDYEYLLKIFEDSETFPPTWAEWVDVAEAKVKYFESLGKRGMRVPIDPYEFPRWCVSNGYKADAVGRLAFVASKLAQREADGDEEKLSPQNC